MSGLITTCCILHNIWKKVRTRWRQLLVVLYKEGLNDALVEGDDDDDAVEFEDASQVQTINNAEEKRSLVGVYLPRG